MKHKAVVIIMGPTKRQDMTEDPLVTNAISDRPRYGEKNLNTLRIRAGGMQWLKR